ncbi:MAG: hypothetical protein NZ874_02665 [Fimbriimonadales bacterium]|nr:hypothetical protein [Fimbriimonadales bacterium]
MASRVRRAVHQGLWAAGLSLTLASGVVLGQALDALGHAQLQSNRMQQGASQLESALLQMERSLLGLAHADSPRIRFVGYDPDALYSTLRRAHAQADALIQQLIQQSHTCQDWEFQHALLRLELEWQQTRAQLAGYLGLGKPTSPSNSTLLTFSLRGQDTIGDALADFKCAVHQHTMRAHESSRRQLVSALSTLCLSVGLLGWLVWRRWGAPARWMRRALEAPHRSATYERLLEGSEWAELYQLLVFQERRLREVELFMRDLAMGRTPEPIKPTDAADPLARSGAWLLKRIEQLNAARREAV